MEFLNLPAGCPPKVHGTSALQNVYRVLEGESPVGYDFLTHKERGKAKPKGACDCRWSSLSLFRDPSAAKKLPNLRHLTHAAKLDIPAGAGAHFAKDKANHVDFWRASSTETEKFVVAIVEIQEVES